MIRDTWEERDRDAGHVGTAAVPVEWAALAAELATEFCAPVAIFDPRHKRWCSVAGALRSQFPEINDSLFLLCRSTELAQGRAMTWRRPLDCKRVWWLLLPASDGLVAFVGFQAPADAAPETAECDETLDEMTDTAVRWGPVCAEPALRAWGEQVAGRYLRAPRVGRSAIVGRERIRRTLTRASRSTG